MPSNEVGQPPTAPRQDPEENLSGFFRVLAASFAHARDREGAPSSPEGPMTPRLKRGGPRPARRLWPRPILLVAALCVVLAWITPLLLAAREVVVPDALVGSWRTSAPLYSDRGFTITQTSLVLKSGPDRSNVSVHPITGLKTGRSGNSSVYTIEYLVAGATYEFPFRVLPGPPQVISLINQPAVAWQKEGGQFSPSPQPPNGR